MEATISDTSWGRDYHTLITDGIIQNMSFGMQVLKDSWKNLLMAHMNVQSVIYI